VHAKSNLHSTILGALGGGDSLEDVPADYPSISEAAVRAAFEFAAASA